MFKYFHAGSQTAQQFSFTLLLVAPSEDNKRSIAIIFYQALRAKFQQRRRAAGNHKIYYSSSEQIISSG